MVCQVYSCPICSLWQSHASVPAAARDQLQLRG